MTPDVALTLAFTLTALESYYLWATDRAPRIRSVLGLLAVVMFVAAAVVHNYLPPTEIATGIP